MINKLVLIEVVEKLVGDIDPVGETNKDKVRLDNLEKLFDLINHLARQISYVYTMNRTSYEDSVKKASLKAKQILDSIAEYSPCFNENNKQIEQLEAKLNECIIDSNNQRHNYVLEQCKTRELEARVKELEAENSKLQKRFELAVQQDYCTLCGSILDRYINKENLPESGEA